MILLEFKVSDYRAWEAKTGLFEFMRRRDPEHQYTGRYPSVYLIKRSATRSFNVYKRLRSWVKISGSFSTFHEARVNAQWDWCTYLTEMVDFNIVPDTTSADLVLQGERTPRRTKSQKQQEFLDEFESDLERFLSPEELHELRTQSPLEGDDF